MSTPTNTTPKANRRLFYGWAIVAASGLVVFSSGPGQSYVFSIFIDSIIADTGLSRPGISALYMASTGVSAVLVAIVSRLADRYGPRAMLVAIGLGFGGGCFGMATATNIVLFYIAFASLRALGQGSLTINAVLLVNQWFVSRRGKAIAMMGLGAVLSNGAFPPVARALIDGIGWREAYGVIGVASILLIVPVTLLVVRNRPEDVGLFPDGVDEPPASEVRRARAGAPREVRVFSSMSFWLLALSLGTPGLVSTALVFHQTSIFEESGLSATLAAGVFIVFAASSAVSSLVAGFAVDRTGPKQLYAFTMATLLVSLVLAVAINSVFMAVAYVLVMGVAGGCHHIVQGVIWAHYYGRHGLGRVQGSAMTINFCASAIGPLPLALFRDLSGTYTLGMVVMMALPVLSVVALVLARPGDAEVVDATPVTAPED
ncbi:MAG: MFS transporter [SAR202 cluster bacterium]|nr:MFS transporter [SAR202 cluster bacterium]